MYVLIHIQVFSLTFPQVFFDNKTSCEERVHQRASIVDPLTGNDQWTELFKIENIKQNAEVFNLFTWTFTMVQFFISEMYVLIQISVFFQVLENKRKRNILRREGVMKSLSNSLSVQEVWTSPIIRLCFVWNSIKTNCYFQFV